jgi:uncharacterized protein with HEPN domain
MKERDYASYIEDIVEHMNYTQEFIRCMTFEEFANDKKTILSVTKCIEIVGEATKHIPDSIREKYPEVPWREMAGIRDRLQRQACSWLLQGKPGDCLDDCDCRISRASTHDRKCIG